MKLEISNNKDFWAGMMFIVTGGVAIIESRDYGFGALRHMGPGFLPTVVGGILVVFGIYLAIRGLRSNKKMTGNWSLRALVIVPLAMMLFGLLMEYAGFIPALASTTVLAAASVKKFKILDVLLIALVLNIFAVAVFVWGLGLPFPLIKAF